MTLFQVTPSVCHGASVYCVSLLVGYVTGVLIGFITTVRRSRSAKRSIGVQAEPIRFQRNRGWSVGDEAGDYKLEFGKYRGMALKDIPDSYLHWMKEQDIFKYYPKMHACYRKMMDYQSANCGAG